MDLPREHVQAGREAAPPHIGARVAKSSPNHLRGVN